MTEMRTQIGEMRYNAAEEQFEALVTFHSDAGRVRVASTFKAPVTTQPDAAERVLVSRALALLDRPDTLQARTAPLPSERVRRPRDTVPRKAGLGWLSLFRAA
ncbi:hypothetical protein [Alloyangia pacifica]|uniref:Uncharacterized protein n=1 Tax=Alloyangia pacifica TaxID=311180 RepID=A0A1I6VB13_9RHOB|nr:hypothetical protein [Alloyangia pacifica]SDH86527.1 hypothetical protein SAMN04488245_110109 [Alloyangia pacifica]SFT10714.1 hypothetical protein SAMN04488050_110156 [Alloyangia pacifica]